MLQGGRTRNHELDAAAGCLTGIVIGVLLWVLIATLIYVL